MENQENYEKSFDKLAVIMKSRIPEEERTRGKARYYEGTTTIKFKFPCSTKPCDKTNAYTIKDVFNTDWHIIIVNYKWPETK